MGHLFRECPNTRVKPEGGNVNISPQRGVSDTPRKREFVTIRNHDGSPRDKILRKDVRAYHGLMEEFQEDRDVDRDVEDDEDVVLAKDDELVHDQVMAYFGAGTDM
jgi:hypothetical protein